jgi:hypothetical protein
VQNLRNLKISKKMVETRSRSQSSRQPRQSGSLATNGSGSQTSQASSARTKAGRRKAAATSKMIDQASGSTSRLFQALKLLVCVCGIYSAYITQGLFQEILSTKKFGGSERFPHLATLNAFQSFACFLWAGGLILVSEVLFPSRKSKGGDGSHPPFTAYVTAGFTNCFGPALGFQALYYIPYPAQVRPCTQISPFPFWHACHCHPHASLASLASLASRTLV